MKMPSHLHLGYTSTELAQSPYAAFFRDEMAPLPEHVKEALLTGGLAYELFPLVDHADELLEPGYWPLETGFGLGPDGSVQVFALTQMPKVTPAMWDWWFAWHGSEAQRYKLWHPRAHISSKWADGRSDLNHYIGRTSKVVEYVGPELLSLTIRFVAPASMGLDENRLKRQGEVAWTSFLQGVVRIRDNDSAPIRVIAKDLPGINSISFDQKSGRSVACGWSHHLSNGYRIWLWL